MRSQQGEEGISPSQEAEQGGAELPGPILSTQEGFGLSLPTSNTPSPPPPPAEEDASSAVQKRDYGTFPGLLHMGLAGEETL